jgi:DNA-binding SARP family transcriptional activator/tetratricopeptide (TPR) repeat protein
MPEEMEFGLLGSLVVRRHGTELPVRRGSERVVLAALLLEANRIVSVDAIAQAVWADRPPPSAGVVIRNCVRRLRQALGEAGRERISTQPRGYLIRAADSELDLHRFEQLLRSAREAGRDGLWVAAADLAREALALWRGEPLAGVESQTLELREIPRLAELRLQALEIRFEASLHLGRQAESVAELQHLAAAHPLREHLQALLMLAHYRCGRQSDSLAVYRNTRRALVQELGAEPGAELQRLHQQILAADPALDLGQPAAGQNHADAALTRGAPVPRQLPAAVAGFTGRAEELQTLARIVDQADEQAPGTVVISAIGGTAGVGKTALAVHFAQHAAGRFPDGQLYMNLRGFDPGGAPAAPSQAIRGFLDALGVTPDRVPPGVEAQQGLYRSLVAGRRMLILLDNAADEQQVRPLLPASAACLVVVTSRRQLTGLAASDNARLLNLDVLTEAEACQMLTTRIGSDRTSADTGATAEIARLCSCLPLALAVAGARAAARPGFPLTALADELRDASGRLDALDAGEPAANVRSVLSWSYRQLTPAAARMFRLLSTHPGPDISVPAAASLAGCGRPDARRLLAELSRVQLIAEGSPARYAFHDLLRAYAADQARASDSEADRHQATGRLLDHYLETAYNACRLLRPHRKPAVFGALRPGVTPEQPADALQALAWLDAEHQVLIAAVALAAKAGFDAHAWQIPCAMGEFLDMRGFWQQWAAIQRTSLAAAIRLGDVVGQADSSRFLAIACARLGEYEQARTHLAAGLKLSQQIGDLVRQGYAYQSLGVVYEHEGRNAEALGCAQQCYRLFEAAGDLGGQYESLNNIGFMEVLLGDFAQAQATCQQALALTRGLGDRRLEAHAWDSLGYAEEHLGHHAQAADCYARALTFFRELGDRYHSATILTHMGDSNDAAGDQDAARRSWKEALDILDDLHHTDAGPLRARLATKAVILRSDG